MPAWETKAAAWRSTAGCGNHGRMSMFPGTAPRSSTPTCCPTAIATGPRSANASRQVRKNSGRSLKAVPSETKSTGSSGGDHPPSSSRVPGDGPTNRNRSSKVSAPGWNSRGTKTTFREAGASIPTPRCSSTPCAAARSAISRTTAGPVTVRSGAAGAGVDVRTSVAPAFSTSGPNCSPVA
jgi:hypothetical protein